MPLIRFSAELLSVNSRLILSFPKEQSEKLPSRGMVMAAGTINGCDFLSPLEPDGKGSHWLELESALLETVNTAAGDTVEVTVEPVKKWPEPEVPEDLKAALEAAPKALETWMLTTPAARWDWIRWIRSTKNPDTRRKRIDAACSKLIGGEKRPCCFNRNMCTDPQVSKCGVLLDS